MLWKKKPLKHLLKYFKNISIKNNKTYEIILIKIIDKLLKNKTSTLKGIPSKIIVNAVHVYSQALTNVFNDFVKRGSFLDIFKNVDVTPIFRL